ncbi:MAG TPA: hypothetical protein P5272_04035 [Caldisericia bacterium]|nr:hypothetical protein [Caldisericia bacterium]HPC57262.1 hypothetical protein [Caldisericia bacterium]HRT37228.1 hypothetical protein [Caldisericia bacterium]HRU74138.1 hypothetical protein [Caldisericia bacterium]
MLLVTCNKVNLIPKTAISKGILPIDHNPHAQTIETIIGRLAPIFIIPEKRGSAPYGEPGVNPPIIFPITIPLKPDS